MNNRVKAVEANDESREKHNFCLMIYYNFKKKKRKFTLTHSNLVPIMFNSFNGYVVQTTLERQNTMF